MIKLLAQGLLLRLAAYIALGLGLWLIFRGFWVDNFLLAVLGGVLVLGGMWLMVLGRRAAVRMSQAKVPSAEGESPSDTVNRSGQGS
ncbi:MAG: hypothetical protein FJ316_12255 [SAR202 cluster bacterium]|nr:hypothetical protein [SAR202 cluster bacterium]